MSSAASLDVCARVASQDSRTEHPADWVGGAAMTALLLTSVIAYMDGSDVANLMALGLAVLFLATFISRSPPAQQAAASVPGTSPSPLADGAKAGFVSLGDDFLCLAG